jgi:type II pantothenate kinase
LLPEGALGVDAGLTLTKSVRVSSGVLSMSAHETRALSGIAPARGPAGVTGARAASIDMAGATASPEIEAAARGVIALMTLTRQPVEGDFVLALLGTGTAFAAVRDGVVQHLGGTPMGGGSFAGIARRIDSSLTYEAMISGAARGDRRDVDVMVSDAYPGGIGRIGPDLTAAHLAKTSAASIDDVLAGLLNMHGENMGQIAAARAVVAKISRIVLAGGFAHGNGLLVESIAGMTRLFGIETLCAPSPGFAGALGAALIAADAVQATG